MKTETVIIIVIGGIAALTIYEIGNMFVAGENAVGKIGDALKILAQQPDKVMKDIADSPSNAITSFFNGLESLLGIANAGNSTGDLGQTGENSAGDLGQTGGASGS